MKNDDKKMKRLADSPKAADDKSLKKQWQTPEIIEEDVRKTEVGPPNFGTTDMGMYS